MDGCGCCQFWVFFQSTCAVGPWTDLEANVGHGTTPNRLFAIVVGANVGDLLGDIVGDFVGLDDGVLVGEVVGV